MNNDLQPQGCLTALLDLSFTQFVTTKLAGWLYLLLLILVVLGGAVGVISGLTAMFSDTFLAGGGIIIASVLGVLIYAVLARVAMESILVIFRIAENTSEMARQGRNQQL